ncbi:MAG: hypothetical protein M1426_02235, partial [Patescibacteria group bacterium]|nr:hypothetical protein [Patescibacteria group bacterium]
DISRALTRLSSSQLIEIVRLSPEITQDKIDQLYEEYRYRRKPSFYLYSLVQIRQDVTLEDFFPPEWSRQFTEEMRQDDPEEGTPNSKNITFLDIEKIDDGVIEIHFSFENIYKYISPETEEPDHIYELRYSFIWISFARRFMVIHSVTDTIKKQLERFIQGKLLVRLSPIVLSKRLVDLLFDEERIIRTSLYNPNPDDEMPEKLLISDRRMHQKRILDRFEGYESPGRVYEEE